MKKLKKPISIQAERDRIWSRAYCAYIAGEIGELMGTIDTKGFIHADYSVGKRVKHVFRPTRKTVEVVDRFKKRYRIIVEEV